jgi:hypothetical protein
VSRKIVIFPRTRKKGGAEMRSDYAIIFDTDPKNIKPMAEAAVEVVEREINAIRDQPAQSTIKRRGPGRLFNVTGRLKKGIRLKRKGKTFEIHAPADRLRVDKVRERLGEVAPNLVDANKLHAIVMGQVDVNRMIKKTIHKKKGWVGRAFGWLKR